MGSVRRAIFNLMIYYCFRSRCNKCANTLDENASPLYKRKCKRTGWRQTKRFVFSVRYWLYILIFATHQMQCKFLVRRINWINFKESMKWLPTFQFGMLFIDLTFIFGKKLLDFICKFVRNTHCSVFYTISEQNKIDQMITDFRLLELSQYYVLRRKDGEELKIGTKE